VTVPPVLAQNLIEPTGAGFEDAALAAAAVGLTEGAAAEAAGAAGAPASETLLGR
jgi:hypothetical protein